MKKIGFIAGSLRKEAYSKKTAKALMTLVSNEYEPVFIDISQLTLYNSDLDTNPPESWSTFREQIRPLDGIVFVTPEYNRSVPGVLKNALDIGSRPAGQSVWGGKPALVVSTTPGRLGAFGANHHLRQSLVTLDMPTLPQPEAYIASVGASINETGTFDERTLDFFKKIMNAYTTFLDKNI